MTVFTQGRIMVSLLEMLAGVAFLLTDVLAGLSVLGSALILLCTAGAAVLGRRWRAPEQILMWSVGGLLFGAAGLVLLTVSGGYPPAPSPWLGYSRSTLGSLLCFSFLLLTASKRLAARVARRPTPSGAGKVVSRKLR